MDPDELRQGQEALQKDIEARIKQFENEFGMHNISIDVQYHTLTIVDPVGKYEYIQESSVNVSITL